MTETTPTPFSNRCNILAEFWVNYKTDEEFKDFFEYSDLGLPLSYAVSTGMATLDEIGQGFINETFDLLLDGLGVEDTGFEELDEILDLVDKD